MLATINGTEIYYEVIGSGRPLMLMHGGLGIDHTYFRPWLDPLADDFQLIFFDFSGNGGSPRASFEGVTHGTWADEADGLRQHLGIDKMVLYGLSYGGFLAQEYAIRHQDHLDGLILGSTAPTFDYGDVIAENVKKRASAQQWEDFSAGLGKPVESDEALKAFWPKIFSLYFYDYKPEYLDSFLATTQFRAGAMNHAFANCVPTYNVLDRLKEITVPTLILAGGDDFICPPAQSERIRNEIPNSTMHVFEKSGHMPFIEETQGYIEVMRDWIKALP